MLLGRLRRRRTRKAFRAMLDAARQREGLTLEPGMWPDVIDVYQRMLPDHLKPPSVKCQGWINLASVADELRPLASVRVYCAVPAGENHPTDGDGKPLHRYRSIYWGARSVPEEGE